METLMSMKRFILCAAITATLCTTASGAILIGPDTRNGSFEWLGNPGVFNAAKATHWDTDPDGDVTDWTLWDASKGGPATAFNDSGTENDPLPTHATNGTKVGFLQGNNAAYNLTDHVVALGDVFKYTWDYPQPGRGNLTTQLAYEDALGNIVTIAGTDSTNVGNAVQLGIGSMYTALAGDPAIGRKLGITIRNVPTSNYPEIDNVVLTLVPEPSAMIMICLGIGYVWIARRRGDGR
jgi:hypothetical protein